MIDYVVVSEHRDLLGEVPVWCDRTSTLWWIDVIGALLHRLDPRTGSIATSRVEGQRLGSIALRETGGLLLATAEGIDIYDPPTGAQSRLAGHDVLLPRQRFNDGRCDRQGRFWVGSMQEDFRPVGSMFRLDTDGSLNQSFGEITVPNGIAFSPDSRTMYFADTRSFTLWTFDFDADSGALSNRKLFGSTTGRAGRPDGATVDSEGFLWSAEYAGGQVVRYAPDGRVDRAITLPVSHPTSVAFGGDALDTLYITSGRYALTPEQAKQEPLAGALIAIQPGVKGLTEPRYRG